jgi:hypothetical protein
VEALIVSAALDTNGQNARYVKAAQNHGDTVLEAFAIGKTDPAGVVGRFKVAADKLGGLHIRSASQAKYEYLQFPMDIWWQPRKNDAEIIELAQKADVIHLNNSHKAMRVLKVNKPTLIHHHGSLFRDNHKILLAHARTRKWVSAVSTVDLLRYNTDTLHWLPTAYDISELSEYGETHRREPDGRVRIVSAPTNRTLKHTDLLIKVVGELLAEGLPIDLELVEQKTWAECLERKAQADIVFDQLMFGYGCNAVEAWGLGIPVIAGADDWTLAEMRRQWGSLPFYEATEDTLKERIRAMVKSKALRAEWAGIGMAHVRKYHDEKPALERLAELYFLAIEGFQSGRAIPGKGVPAVVFRSKKRSTVFGTKFVKGEASVTDPDTIEQLRHLAETRPNFGVEEVA